MLNVKTCLNQDLQDKWNQSLDGLLIYSTRGLEIKNLKVLCMIPNTCISKLKQETIPLKFYFNGYV